MTCRSLAELRGLMAPSLTGAATDDFPGSQPPAAVTPAVQPAIPAGVQAAVPAVPTSPVQVPAAPAVSAGPGSAAVTPAPGDQAPQEQQQQQAPTAGQLLAPSTAHCLRLLGLQSLVGAPAADLLRNRSLAGRSTGNMMLLPAASLQHTHLPEHEEEEQLEQQQAGASSGEGPSTQQSTQLLEPTQQEVAESTAPQQPQGSPAHLTHTSSEDVLPVLTQQGEGAPAAAGSPDAGLNRVLTPQPTSQRWEDQINAAISMLRMHR
jgi:hypothetical protein